MMNPLEPLDVWLRIANEDDDFTPDSNGYYNAEANTYEIDTGYRVEWYLSSVGQVTSVFFESLTAAYSWLVREGFENYSS